MSRPDRHSAVAWRCETLEVLTAAAERDGNLLPPMLDAVRAYATLGEIRQSLEDVYGRFKEPVSF